MAVLPRSEVPLSTATTVPEPARSEDRTNSPRRDWLRQHRRAAFWLLGVFAISQAVLAVFIDQDAPTVRDPEFYLLEGMLRDRIAEKPGRATPSGLPGITTRSSSTSASPARARTSRP
jgi:hypothetical protein